jgi:hypothetical protein
MPHVEVRGAGGELFHYADVWQRRHLVLVALPASLPDTSYARELTARSAAFAAHDTVCVVTTDDVPGLPAPAVLVADRWGEIADVTAAARTEDLPTPSRLLEWAEAVDHRCPECEGEAR